MTKWGSSRSHRLALPKFSLIHCAALSEVLQAAAGSLALPNLSVIHRAATALIPRLAKPLTCDCARGARALCAGVRLILRDRLAAFPHFDGHRDGLPGGGVFQVLAEAGPVPGQPGGGEPGVFA